ncbi:MAG TPA: SDR family oxidoreductase [Solirubrobacteraceae bacterium]|nr:SDR family oxidoreductase [Solirubrobacteraceae bacterium]
MEQRAALITGGSSGIGLAIARVLAEEGYALTLTSRRAPKLAAAAAGLRAEGAVVFDLAGDVSEEATVRAVVAAHGEQYGRLDVLVNNAGQGIMGPIDDVSTKHLDLQLAVNLRSVILFYREAMPLLRVAGAGDGALVVNTASIAGKYGTAGLGVYSAAKHGIVGFTEAMNGELLEVGIKSTVLCPAYVDTAMTDALKDRIPASEMITVQDLAETVRSLLRLSPHCAIPEVVFRRRARDVS